MSVDEKICDERHGNLKEQVKQNTEDIVDLKVVTERVVTLIDYVVNKGSFWETENGKMLFKALLLIAVVVLGVAIGTNIDLTGIMGG